MIFFNTRVIIFAFVIGGGFSGVPGQSPYLFDDRCSKRHSPSRHVDVPEFVGSCLGRKVSSLGGPGVRYESVLFQKI